MAAELQWGKCSFYSGEYKCAFRRLLPVAVYGDPQAEYAVGYMYYYGYGVPIDDDSGLFWMERAAQQHYLPAINALILIHQRQFPCPDLANYCEANSFPREYHPCLEKSGCILPCRPVCSGGIYTLQLMGSHELIDLKDTQAEYALQGCSRVWRTEHNGQCWYVLTYGRYATLEEARCAKEKLSCELRELGPWVRRVSGLKAI